MATKQIPELPEATTAALSDLLVKRDDATGSDQKLPIQTFIENALGSSATDDSSVLPTPDTLAKRDSVGRVQSQSGGSGRAAVVHEDTSSAADAETVVKRDSAGRAEFESGGSGRNAVTYLDGSTTAQPNTFAKRNADARVQSAPGGSGNEAVVHADNVTLPAGAVQYFITPDAPSGWLKADGRAISRSVYSDLFAAVGTTFGAGDGSTTFNLPDLRGEFIRGWDDGRGVDSGRDFGSSQDDELGSHSHSMNSAGNHSHSGTTNTDGDHRHDVEAWAAENSDPTGGVYAVAADSGAGGSQQQDIQTEFAGDHNHSFTTNTAGSHSHTINSAGGPETRPRNVALLACIKF